MGWKRAGNGYKEGSNPYFCIYPEDKKRVMAEWKKSVDKGLSSQIEYRFVTPEGNITWVYGQSVVERSIDGNARGFVGAITDITKRKLAEEALYAYIMHAILSVSSGVQEYVVRRFKQEKSAKLRNAKIRLSNLKLDQIVQVMRGKSKWLKF